MAHFPAKKIAWPSGPFSTNSSLPLRWNSRSEQRFANCGHKIVVFVNGKSRFWGVIFWDDATPPNPRQQNKALWTWNRFFGCLFTMELYHGIYHPITKHHHGRGSNIFAGHFFQVASIPSCKSRFFLDGENAEVVGRRAWGGNSSDLQLGTVWRWTIGYKYGIFGRGKTKIPPVDG